MLKFSTGLGVAYCSVMLRPKPMVRAASFNLACRWSRTIGRQPHEDLNALCVAYRSSQSCRRGYHKISRRAFDGSI